MPEKYSSDKTMNRRAFLKAAGIQTAGLLLTKGLYSRALKEETSVSYLLNKDLPLIRPGYPGSPLLDGRFLNENLEVSNKSFGTIMKWFASRNPQKEEKAADTFKPEIETMGRLAQIHKDCIIWLGHSTFLIHVGKRWLMTDPVLNHLPVQERKTPMPMSWDDLDHIDYLLISHGHYDHLDKDTINRFISRDVTALAPLRMSGLLASMNKYVITQEAGWYQQYTIKEDFKISFLPAQHWYIRMPWDRNKIHWGSFLIETPRHKIFFAGDSAYAPHFKDIGEMFAPDICLMPIGAYKPSYIMKTNHMDPGEAVQAFHDLKGQTFIPMHYGTFDLADEPPGEPIRFIRQMEKHNKIHGSVKELKIGEVFYL